MLKNEQLAELEELGATAVRAKLIQSRQSRDASVHAFKSGELNRSDVEGWLEEKFAEKRDLQNSMRRWINIAAASTITGTVTA